MRKRRNSSGSDWNASSGPAAGPSGGGCVPPQADESNLADLIADLLDGGQQLGRTSLQRHQLWPTCRTSYCFGGADDRINLKSRVIAIEGQGARRADCRARAKVGLRDPVAERLDIVDPVACSASLRWLKSYPSTCTSGLYMPSMSRISRCCLGNWPAGRLLAAA